ncbi:MAG: hypothetical protein OXL68_21350 [Paracoccaceae bacterium]|nr:hypothetical protein [Paracoccaceae bacterium]
MPILGLAIAVAAVVMNCLAFAQVFDGSLSPVQDSFRNPVDDIVLERTILVTEPISVPGTIPALSNIDELKTILFSDSEQQLGMIEIPADLAIDWLQSIDPVAWATIQNQGAADINLTPWLQQQSLTPARLADGIDPFAVYDEDGNLIRVLIRGAGIDPLTFAEEIIAATRKQGQRTVALTVSVGDEQWSSLPQRLVNRAQKAPMRSVRPKDLSLNRSTTV